MVTGDHPSTMVISEIMAAARTGEQIKCSVAGFETLTVGKSFGVMRILGVRYLKLGRMDGRQPDTCLNSLGELTFDVHQGRN